MAGAAVRCGSSKSGPPATPQCLQNSNCSPGLVCALGYCVSECTTSADCPKNERCVISGVTDKGDGGVGNVCQAPESAHCYYNSQCAPPLVCGIDQQCRDQCEKDVDCTIGQKCTSVTKLCADPTVDKNYDPVTNDFVVHDGGVGGNSGAGGHAGADAGAGTGGGGGGPTDASGNGGAGAGGAGGGGGTGGGVVAGGPCGAPVDGGFYGPESTPNDDRDHATPLSIGVGYGACVQVGTDVDWYDINVPTTGQGGYLTVAVTGVGQTTLLKDDLYSAATNGLITYVGSPNGGSSLYTWIAVAAGTPLRVAVYGVFSDGRAVGPYTITAIYQPAVEANEPNDDRSHATPISLGTPVQGLFFRGFVDDKTFSDPSDYYKVTIPAAGMVTAKVTDVSTNLRAHIGLYDPLGGLLIGAGSENATAGADAQVVYSVPAAGTYYVIVTEESLGDVPLVGSGRTLPDVAAHPYTLTVTSP